MSQQPSQRPYGERLLDRVPEWSRARDRQDARKYGMANGQGLLHALVQAVGIGLDDVQADVTRLLGDMFIDTCDPRLIPLIGRLVGVADEPSWPDARSRHRVKYALYLLRRKGTIEQLELTGWQATGFRVQVTELQSARRSVLSSVRATHPRSESVGWQVTGFARHGRPSPSQSGLAAARAARVSGTAEAAVPTRTFAVTGQAHLARLQAVFDVAWPVRRRQLTLTQGDYDIYEMFPNRRVGLRRADGTPIFVHDNPAALVGPGQAIDIQAVGGDFERLGPLRPVFMRLSGDTSFYVPHHTLAIDPESGRVAGPTPPAPGLRSHRCFKAQFWEPLSGERVEAKPAPQEDGVFTFAADSGCAPLTDEQGFSLCVAFEGARTIPLPSPAQRLLIVRERSQDPNELPYALLQPGEALTAAALTQALPLDNRGLARLFAIEDEWGWDRYRHIHLVACFSTVPPPDDTVEVDVGRGRFRVGPPVDGSTLRVRFYRSYDVAAIKRRGERAVRSAVPLGRTVAVVFRDTASGTRGALS